jgi:hypothetical protein
MKPLKSRAAVPTSEHQTNSRDAADRHLRRRAGWLTVALGAVFAGSLIVMVQRVRAFHEATGFPTFHAESIVARQFQQGTFPEVRLEEPLEADLPTDVREALSRLPGMAMMKIVTVVSGAGGKSERATYVPVKAPPARGLPTLDAYADWVKTLAVNEVERTSEGVQRPKAGTDHIFVVVRRPPEGFDPETWGSVRRSEWVFDFHELKPDGTITSFQRRWPRSYRGESTLQAQVLDGDPRLARLEQIPVLEERSIEYFVALHAIPKLSVPNQKFRGTAFNPKVLGWTLPVTMSAALAGSIALVFAIPPRRRRVTMG